MDDIKASDILEVWLNEITEGLRVEIWSQGGSIRVGPAGNQHSEQTVLVIIHQNHMTSLFDGVTVQENPKDVFFLDIKDPDALAQAGEWIREHLEERLG